MAYLTGRCKPYSNVFKKNLPLTLMLVRGKFYAFRVSLLAPEDSAQEGPLLALPGGGETGDRPSVTLSRALSSSVQFCAELISSLIRNVLHDVISLSLWGGCSALITQVWRTLVADASPESKLLKKVLAPHVALREGLRD
jgi:hypothetical protein